MNDLESLDHELFKQLNFLRNYDGEVGDLEMYFSISEVNQATSETREVNLIPMGSEIKVTNQNKFRYIYLMADYRLNRRIKDQSDAFIAGFHECVPLKWLSIFNERELQMLLSGSSKGIDV